MTNRVGQQFGNYRLTRLLGQGGFAEVYLGEHVLIGSPAAIKILYAQLIPTDLQTFLQEARTLVSLEHPQIVRLKECGIEEGTPFVAMDYAPNGTLRQRHPRGSSVPLADVVSYTRQIAAALQYAHDRRLIHRDVKPENMLVGRNGEILLSDFGIAVISATSSMQHTKASAGTAIYMAPEQIFGDPHPASDQYALGIVVYEWLCGDTPYHGSFREITAQHLHKTPPSFSEKGLTIPPAVEALIMKALAKETQGRFASIQEFAMALQQSYPQQQPHLHTGITGNDQSLFISPSDRSSQFTRPPVPSQQPVPPSTTPINPSRITPRLTPPPQQPIPTPLMPTQYYDPRAYPPTQVIPTIPQTPPRSRSGCGILTGIAVIVVIVLVITALALFGSPKGSTGLSPNTPTVAPAQSTPLSGAPPTQAVPVAPSAPDVSGAKSTISSFCNHINSGDTQGAYNLTSQSYQNQNDAGTFTTQFSSPDLFKGGCLYNAPSISNGSVTVPLRFSKININDGTSNTTNYTVTLIQDQQSGTWVINSIM